MLAYFDSFAGLVPCRVVAVGDWNDSSSLARVQYTATRGAYKRGEFDTQTLRHIIPRSAVYTRGGQYRVRAYSWPDIIAAR